MEHVQAEGLWAAYHAGTLDRETVRQLHAHLKDCESCRSRVRLRALSQVGRQSLESHGLASPEIQAQMAKNRDLLVKVLIVVALATLVWHLKK